MKYDIKPNVSNLKVVDAYGHYAHYEKSKTITPSFNILNGQLSISTSQEDNPSTLFKTDKIKLYSVGVFRSTVLVQMPGTGHRELSPFPTSPSKGIIVTNVIANRYTIIGQFSS